MSRSQRSSDERQNQPDAAVRLRPAFRRRLQLGGRRIQAWRPTGLRRWGLIRFLLTSYVAAGVTLYVQPGRSASALALLGPVIAIAVVGTLLRPVLAGAAVVVDSFGLLLIGIVSQAIILDVPIAIDPNVDIGGHPAVLFVSWPAAVVAGAVTWLFDTGTEDTFLAQLLGRAIRVARARARSADSSRETKHDGLIVIQFDGGCPASGDGRWSAADSLGLVALTKPYGPRVAHRAARNDTGGSGGSVAWQRHRGPLISVVREGEWSTYGCEPSAGRCRD